LSQIWSCYEPSLDAAVSRRDKEKGSVWKPDVWLVALYEANACQGEGAVF